MAALALVLLGFGIDRASVATAYSDPVAKLRAQDESAWASAALGLANQGGWLTPKVLGRYVLAKPPLLTWLSGLSLKILGMSLGALRLPSLIAAVLATLVVFWWIWRERPCMAAWSAALLLLSNPLWHIFARLCYTDMLLVGSMAGALAVIYRDPQLDRTTSVWGFGACVAAGVMAKSIAGLLPIFVVLLYSVLAPPERRPAIRRVALASAAAVALIAPWHVYQLTAHRQWFWADYVSVQLIGFGLQPPAQSSAEGPAAFYLKRLALTDPALAILFMLALPSLLISLRRRDQTLPALLTAWIAVTAAALLIFRYRNLPYALYAIPPACLIAVAYGPLFSARRAKWGVLTLCLIFGWKCYGRSQPWGLAFGAAEPLPAVAALRYYYDLGRPNELILADTDDEFYSETLPLLRVRYYVFDPNDVVRRYSPHYAYLGIILPEEEFEKLSQLRGTYAERLKSWGLDSAEPIGTAITGRSAGDLGRLIRACPDADYYVGGEDLRRLEGDATIARSHRYVTLPDGRAFLLARETRPGASRKVVALPARW